MNKTKVVATIGPASYGEDVMAEMIAEGVNVCRINFSHGSHKEYKSVINAIRRINRMNRSYVAILADLQGPKIRIGEIDNAPIVIEEGKELIITTQKAPGNAEKVFINYAKFPRDVKKGDKIQIDDGKIVLQVLKTDGKKNVHTKIIQGGEISSNKGVNLPNSEVSLPSLTDKDKKDLSFALDQNVEWVALSFVRSAKDIAEVKRIIARKKKTARVIAKIEKPQAIEDIDNIIAEADGLMVARGDLGVEIPMEDVPLIQKKIVRKCRSASKPVIIATQMMESMMESIRPSRAETNDVANSVMDGTDAVMLSAETSLGKHPVEVIKAITKIITKAETFDDIYHKYDMPDPEDKRFVSDSICFNACKLAQRIGAKALTTMSFSGYSGIKISSYRPTANTFVFTANKSILYTLSLVWGVRGFYYNEFESTDDTIADIMERLKKEGLVNRNDYIVNIASMPIADMGKSNMLKLSTVT